MSLDELYQEVIMDHYARPRNKGRLEHPDIDRELANPVCGDVIRVQVALDGGRVGDVRFSGKGCSISQASASMMTELIKGRTLDEARGLIERFLAMMKGEPGDYGALRDLQALQGVSRYPVRIKCATLAWHVLEGGLPAAAADAAAADAGGAAAADAVPVEGGGAAAAADADGAAAADANGATAPGKRKIHGSPER